MVKSNIIFYLLISLASSYSYGQVDDSMRNILSSRDVTAEYPTPIKTKNSGQEGSVFKDYHNQLENKYSMIGVWKKVKILNPTLNLLVAEDCPQGRYLIFYPDYANIFDYYDEDITSIDFMFDYKQRKNRFKGVFTNSNAILFEEEHRNKTFEFVIQVFRQENVLIMITSDQKVVTYKKFAEIPIPTK
ncbi:MAG: hypothetical protein ACI837_003573 [Crocinitomicaceae bacterium]|jgi:hypothetical protein